MVVTVCSSSKFKSSSHVILPNVQDRNTEYYLLDMQYSVLLLSVRAAEEAAASRAGTP